MFSQQHIHVSSSYRSSRLGLSYWDPYAMHRGGCLELYYCNMVEWCWWDSSLIWKTNWFPSVLWHCWFGLMTCKNRPRYDLWCVWWDVKPCSISVTVTASPVSLLLLQSSLISIINNNKPGGVLRDSLCNVIQNARTSASEWKVKRHLGISCRGTPWHEVSTTVACRWM